MLAMVEGVEMCVRIMSGSKSIMQVNTPTTLKIYQMIAS